MLCWLILNLLAICRHSYATDMQMHLSMATSIDRSMTMLTQTITNMVTYQMGCFPQFIPVQFSFSHTLFLNENQ